MVRRSVQALLPAIRDKYVPKIDDEGNFIKSNDKGTWEGIKGTPDPAVVWCGPFMDALVHFGIFSSRQSAKVFMYEANDDAKKAENHQLHVYRAVEPADAEDSWNNGYPNVQYEEAMRLMSLPGRSREAGRAFEPGEILDSPTTKVDDVNPWDVNVLKEHISPTIDIDPRYKLHILYRGDKITKKFKTFGLDAPVTETFVLRPPTEGSSRIFTPNGNRELVL